MLSNKGKLGKIDKPERESSLIYENLENVQLN
jgi:hypothetical protein